MTALRIGAAPVAKTADQLRAERRDRRTARSAWIGGALDVATLAVMSILTMLLFYGSGPFEGAKLIILGGLS